MIYYIQYEERSASHCRSRCGTNFGYGFNSHLSVLTLLLRCDIHLRNLKRYRTLALLHIYHRFSVMFSVWLIYSLPPSVYSFNMEVDLDLANLDFSKYNYNNKVVTTSGYEIIEVKGMAIEWSNCIKIEKYKHIESISLNIIIYI